MYRGRARELLKRYGVDIGDRVKIQKNNSVYEGLIMPRSELGDDMHIVLKLDNGYNIGINISKIKKIEKIERKEEIKKVEFKKIEKKGLQKVYLLGTGGTIASKIDYKTGAVSPSFTAEEIVNAIPEVLDIADIDAGVLFNILSENMTPKHWRKIAREVARLLNAGYSGVVVAHGTDTMSYTASALAFMLKNLSKPVVFVGAQRSSDRPSSDASLNLLSALRVATSDIAEVTVVMHATSSDDSCYIHRATRVRKMHSSRRDAFRSINSPPLGIVRGRKIETFTDYRKRSDEEVLLDDKLEERVALVKIYPGIDKELFDFYIDRYLGIVIEGTGLGHVPSYLIPSIERGVEEGKIIAMATQTIYGRVDMKVYSTGRELLARGVISCEDMLAEVAYVKLMHILAKTQDREEVERLMKTNLAGEISERSLYNTFLI